MSYIKNIVRGVLEKITKYLKIRMCMYFVSLNSYLETHRVAKRLTFSKYFKVFKGSQNYSPQTNFGKEEHSV